MSETRPVRVLVVGGGPAGLSAATRLLERGRGRVHVRLATMGHHLGGKASSWRDAEGRIVEHGQHVVVGWYREMKALLGRAGVDAASRMVSNGGHTHFYEPRDGKVHSLDLKRNPFHMLASGLGYSGLTAGEKASVASFFLGNLGLFLGVQDIEDFDDVCFTAFALANGIKPSLVQTSIFRAGRTAQLNWPGDISTYSLLKATRMVGRDYKSAEYSFPDGGMSERYWQPIGDYFARLGGELVMLNKLIAVERDGRKITGAVFAEPHSAGHEQPEHPRGAPRFEGQVPVKPDSRRVVRDFDHLISTLPCTALQELNPGDAGFWGIPELAAVRRLRGVRPLGLHMWHREPIRGRYPGAIGGLDGPLCYLVDNKHVYREYRYDPRYGAALHFVGQETGCEQWSDEQLLQQCLDNLARIPGCERLSRDGLLHWQVVRHHTPDKQYFYTEPGIQRFRPHIRTPLANFFLAGDWVRNEVDFPCMESAIRCGRAAADAVLESAA